MKTRFWALATVAALSLTMLTGCGNSGTSTSGSGETSGETSSEAKPGTETVKIICGYGVGGTADLVARKYAQVANQVQSEYNFIVENMTGGDGFAAATYYADEDPSTTDMWVYGYGVYYRHDLGKTYQTEVVDFDREAFYPIGTIDDRTWIVYTTPDKTLADILEQSKNGGIKMSGGNPLSDCHLALGSLIAQEGGNVTVVPYDGGAAQKKGLTDGEVDVFVGTTQAAIDEVEAGTLVPILAFSETAFDGFVGPDGPISVPTVAGETKAAELDASKDYSGSILPAGGGLAVRTGADQEWIDKMTEVMKAVWAEPEYYEWIESVMLNKFEAYGEEAQAVADEGAAKALAAFEQLS